MPPTFQNAPSATGRVLIADDQEHILEALQLLLKGQGFSTELVTHPSRVLPALESSPFDAVLMDLNYARDTTSGIEGLELVSQIRSMDKVLPVVVMTAWSSVDLAVAAMRRGASDFVQKPWENSELLEKLETQLSQARDRRRIQQQQDHEEHEAREIQRTLLPRRLPEVPGYELAVHSQPLRFVGGDYYDVERISPQHTVFCIADVAGKGLSAALLMSSLQAALKPLIAQRLEPRELCRRLNRILCDLTPVGKFISFFVAVLNSTDHRLTYCNAGHNPPILVRADGTSMELNAQGAVLGQFPRWVYEESDTLMRSGDRLLIFTDGLIEACNDGDDFFGEHNLIRTTRDNPTSGAKGLVTLLMRAASEHCGERFQDDATLMVIKAT